MSGQLLFDGEHPPSPRTTSLLDRILGARPALRRRVVFGQFSNWEQNIRRRLDVRRYSATFSDLVGVHLSAFDAVVPLGLRHYEMLRGFPELRSVKFLHPEDRVVQRCDDKLAFMRFLGETGFGDVAPALRAAGPPYPYVWKRRHAANGDDCHVIRTEGDEQGLDLDNSDWFAQDLAPGVDEFAAHILRRSGTIRYASTFAYRMSGPDRVRGAAEAPRSKQFTRGCPHLALFDRVLDRLDYEGTACFNYKVVDGRPLIFELNPRFGGSLAHDINRYLDAYMAALA